MSQCTPDGWVFYPVAYGTSCRSGTGTCDGGKLGPRGQLEPDALGECGFLGQQHPHDYVLKVVYAAPGNGSSVSYAAGSTSGSSTSDNRTYSNTAEVMVNGAVLNSQAEPNGVKLTFDYSHGWGTSNGYTVDTKVTVTDTFTLPAQTLLGVDHDWDQVHFLVNPVIDVLLTPKSNRLYWAFNTAAPGLLTWAWVKWLNDPGLFLAENGQLYSYLTAAGLVPQDFTNLSAADPFGHGGTAIDPNRFKRLANLSTIPYITMAPNQLAPATFDHVSTSDYSFTASSSVTYDNAVSASVSGPLSFLNPFSTLVSVDGSGSYKHTWTHSVSNTSSTGTTVTDHFIIGQPSSGYTGTQFISVYFDNMFKTYLFVNSQ